MINERKGLVRVIVDPRDASKDVWIPKEDAKKLLKEHKLLWDATNHTYCEK